MVSYLIKWPLKWYYEIGNGSGCICMHTKELVESEVSTKDKQLEKSSKIFGVVLHCSRKKIMWMSSDPYKTYTIEVSRRSFYQRKNASVVCTLFKSTSSAVWFEIR